MSSPSWPAPPAASKAAQACVQIWSSLPVRTQFPRLHADCIRKVALQRDAGRQRAVKDVHLGDPAVRVEQDEEDPVDCGVSDLQPEVCGVVGLPAEHLI